MRDDEPQGYVTMYSEKFSGDKGNYDWAVRFDNTGPADYCHEPGYFGITQFDEYGKAKGRVLMTWQQAEEFAKFIRRTRKP